MKRACVIGWPIEHSRSPIIHGYWLERYGIDGAYTKEAVPPEQLAQFIGSLAARGFVGCNVTVPHKEAAYKFAAVRDSSTTLGAVNTLWLDERGKLCAANTDIYGYMAHLNAQAPEWRKRNGLVSVLGAGGAARAIVYGFLTAGVGEVRLFNRSRARAEDLAKLFGTRVRVLPWDERSERSRDSAVLVNTTTLGMKGEGSVGIDFTGFHPDCIVSDIVYVPLETELLRTAREQGLKTVDGLGMLLHQAVPGFEKWFGVRPEVTAELRSRVVADIEGR